MSLRDFLDYSTEDYYDVEIWDTDECETIFKGTVDEANDYLDENGDRDIASWEIGKELIVFNVDGE